MAEKYTEIGRKLAELEFPHLRNENPEFSRCLGYLSILMDEIADSGNITAVYRFAEVFAHFGQIAIARGWQVEITTVYQNLEKAAVIAAAKKSDVIHTQVANAYVLLVAKHIDHLSPGPAFQYFFESLNTSTRLFLASSNDRAYPIANQFVEPYNMLASSIAKDIPLASNPVNQNRYDVQSGIITKLDQIDRALLALCRATPLIERIIVLQYADALESLCGVLLPNLKKQTWDRNADALGSELRALANLYGWFAHDHQQIKLSYID